MDKLSRIKNHLRILDILDEIDQISDSDEHFILPILVVEKSSTSKSKNVVDSSIKTEAKKRRCSTKLDKSNPIRGLRDASNPLESYSDEKFIKTYRFRKEIVSDILQMILYGLARVTNRGHPLPPVIELLVTLKFLATGK